MHLSTVIRCLVLLAALAGSGCASNTETVTTTTTPDGVVTQTVQRPIVDPFDVALADAARLLFTLQGGEQ